MVIPQVSSSVKMRRCGYCMVKVGINSVLAENAQPLLLSDLEAWQSWPINSGSSCCWKTHWGSKYNLLTDLSFILNGRMIQLDCVATGVMINSGMSANFPRLKQVPAESCKHGSSFDIIHHGKILFNILTATSTRPYSIAKKVILKVSW